MSAASTEGLNGFPIPIGTVLMWANDSSKPQLVVNLETTSGFLVCDGREFAIADYPELYQFLGGAASVYMNRGGVPAAGNFRLPNLPDPDGAAGTLGFLIGSISAGTIIAPSPQTPIATATISLQTGNIPDFPLEYDAALPYQVAGAYYCSSSKDGSKITTKVYSKSNKLVRNPSGNNFLREDVSYSSQGGIGNDAIAPLVRYTNPNATGRGDPIDITASITQNTFTAPSFDIVAIIRARSSAKFNP